MTAKSSAIGPKDRKTVLIDGHCVLCSRWYRFVTARDGDRRFHFVAIQSAEGKDIARRFGIDPDDPETFALVVAGSAWFKSEAVLRILGALPRWRRTALLRLIPLRLRDSAYDLIARNRYRWFGRLEICSLPVSSGRAEMP